jgi:ubiquinone/menaquinone biosynthesis C-methylase UbiE
VFEKRSLKLERIDTGDYTPAEYACFLREIAFINRMTGDLRTVKKTLFREIERENLRGFSVLDVGAGSGEMLRFIAGFARKTRRKSRLTGIELNERSAAAIRVESRAFGEISSVRGDGTKIPFADGSFDYAVCSLFTHHLPDEIVVDVLREMARVSRRGIFVIDLHRNRVAYTLYRLFCGVFRISRLVREDGLLSIQRSFKPNELSELAKRAGLQDASVERHLIYRLVLRVNHNVF